jgi:Spy/CpxP family protein refolding chaperone
VVLDGKTPAECKKSPKRPVQPQAHPLRRLLSELNLSKDQTNQIKEMSLKFQKDLATLKNNLQIKQLELKSLWLAENLDKEALKSKLIEASDLRGQIQEKTLDYQLELRKVLTPEQWNKVSLFFTFARNRWGGRWVQMWKVGPRR